MAGKAVIVCCLYLLGVLLPECSTFVLFSSGPSLKHYNVDKSQISVSGVSSGSAMATQIHVIYSRTIMGAGLIAGPPFACANHNIAVAVTSCMQTPSFISPTELAVITRSGAAIGNVDAVSHLAHDRVYIFDGKADSVVNPDPSLISATELAVITRSGAAIGNVDAVSHLAHDRVYIFYGKADNVVNPAIGQKTADFYKQFISSASHIKTEFSINAEHSQPTSNYGGACATLNKPSYMNNCHFSAAFEILNFIYGGHLTRPSTGYVARGQLLKFAQDDFFYVSLPSFYSMDNVGYVYVPTGCAGKTHKCKLHVAFHGCEMGQSTIGDKYVRHAGYNEVGELNDIIILYPQAISMATNPHGCWDWFGYTGQLFATNSGFQPTAIKRMIDRVTG